MFKPLFLLALFLGFLSASASGRTAWRRSYSDYDQLKRLVRVQDADGQTLQFDFNADGDRVSMLDANGQRTRWSYDGSHRPVSKTYMDGTGESWDYVSGANLLAGATNARGARTSFAYSPFDELAGIGYPNTATTSNVSFTYDLLGRKASMTDGIGTSGWSYDSVGRLQGESGPYGNDGLSYSYDSLNRVQSLSIGRDATTSDTESFGYDGLGRLASVNASAGAFGNVGTFGYSYVGNTSLLAQMTRPNGTKTLLSYENTGTSNALHRLTGVQDVSATGGNIASFGYGYDSPTTTNGFVDNRTSQTRSYGSEGAQTISYGYNPTSMLQGEGGAQGGASTPALSKSYVFDAMGNRTGMSDAVAKTQTTSTYNALNQLTGQSSYSTSTGAAVGTGSSAFGYDGDGNMSLVTAKDASGTVTGQTTYSYDDASRLIGITTPGGSKWQFVYDGMSRLRISRSWNWVNNAWVQNSEKRRVYLGMDVVQERDQNNNVTASYTRMGNIGGLLARSTSTGSVFYGYDGGGNVTSLTDATGAVVGSYTYDAWGNTIASSGASAQENPYRFSTKEQLAGYAFYGRRCYSLGLGRWINRDPIKEHGGGNLYIFVGNNPTNQVDFYGLRTWAIGPNGRPWLVFDTDDISPPGSPLDKARRAAWTGDPNASDDVYSNAVNGAADWAYECDPIRGAYVSWGRSGKVGPGKVGGTITGAWTQDSGWGGSGSVGWSRGGLPGSPDDGWSGSVSGSYGWSQGGGWKSGVSGGISADLGNGGGPTAAYSWSDPLNGGKVTGRAGWKFPNGVGAGVIWDPSKLPNPSNTSNCNCQ